MSGVLDDTGKETTLLYRYLGNVLPLTVDDSGIPQTIMPGWYDLNWHSLSDEEKVIKLSLDDSVTQFSMSHSYSPIKYSLRNLISTTKNLDYADKGIDLVNNTTGAAIGSITGATINGNAIIGKSTNFKLANGLCELSVAGELTDDALGTAAEIGDTIQSVYIKCNIDMSVINEIE